MANAMTQAQKIQDAKAACFEGAKAKKKIAAKVKEVFAGVSAKNREAVQTALYDSIREEDGRDENGKLVAVSKHSQEVRDAYDAARKAVSRLFAKAKGKGKAEGKGGKAKAKAEVVAALKSRADVGPSVAYWQGQEGGGNIPRILAALKVLGELLPE